MNASIEQIVEDIVRNRAGRRRVAKVKRKRPKYERAGLARKLTLVEVCEFRAAVNACIERQCAAGNYCWREGCPRCCPA